MTAGRCEPDWCIARPSSTSSRERTWLTNAQLLPAEQPVIDRYQAQGGDPDVIRLVLGVAPEYLEATLNEMHKVFGTIEGHFSEGLKIDEGAQKALRAAFTETV